MVAKTDGVPLFVEELTKMVLESGLLQEREERYELTGPLPPLAIPTTLHDSLMARLDRLATVKGLAQLGATLGREFSYALLQAVSPWDEETVQRGLHQLVAAEFLYQQGLPPQATYLFKHALIQDAAYQSLLKSTPAAVPPAIAQVLDALSRHGGDPTGTAGPPLHGGGPRALRPWATGSGPGSRPLSARHLCGSDRAPDHGPGAARYAPRHPGTRPAAELDVPDRPGAGADRHQGLGTPEVERCLCRRGSCASRWGDASQLVRCSTGLWDCIMARAEHSHTAWSRREQLLDHGPARARTRASPWWRHQMFGADVIF